MQSAPVHSFRITDDTKSTYLLYIYEIWAYNSAYNIVFVAESRSNKVDDASEHKKKKRKEETFYLRRYNLVNVEESNSRIIR